MKTRLFASSAALALGAIGVSGVAQAAQGVPELGRVISSTPIVQQVAVPRQVCTQQQMGIAAPNSGGGALLGAVAGAVAGNAIGQGNGRALATVAGVVGGAVLGNNIEGNPTQVQTVQQCSTQSFYENRTTGYNVVYEYGGAQYTVQMPNDPGPTVALQLTPVGAAQAPAAPIQPIVSAQPGQVPYPQADGQSIIANTAYVTPVYGSPGYVAPIYAPYYAPTVVYPRYYSGGYYPPVGISLGLGYRGGYGGYRGGYGGHRR